MPTPHACLMRLCATVPAAMLCACATSTPNWDEHFGQTVRLTQARQIVNPKASANADPVAGVDGPAARAALERYERSFREPAPQTSVFTIGVSGGK